MDWMAAILLSYTKKYIFLFWCGALHEFFSVKSTEFIIHNHTDYAISTEIIVQVYARCSA